MTPMHKSFLLGEKAMVGMVKWALEEIVEDYSKVKGIATSKGIL
jgi:hypothetical protein